MSRTGNSSGFTLIEVMITVTILAIGIVGVLRGYISSLNALEAGRYTMDASAVLRQRMELLEEKNIKKGTLLPGTESGGGRIEDRGFGWETDVERVVITEKPVRRDLNKVKVSVFNSHIKPVKTLDLTTYMEIRSEK